MYRFDAEDPSQSLYTYSGFIAAAPYNCTHYRANFRWIKIVWLHLLNGYGIHFPILVLHSQLF